MSKIMTISGQRIKHPELKMLLELPAEKRYEKFSHYSIEEQLEIHFAAMNQVYPPSSLFGEKMAKDHREKIIPFLIEKIKIEKNEALSPQTLEQRKWDIKLRKQGIFIIFTTMIGIYKCDLKITLEQINFLNEENLLIYEQATRLDESISQLLRCPQFN